MQQITNYRNVKIFYSDGQANKLIYLKKLSSTLSTKCVEFKEFNSSKYLHKQSPFIRQFFQ